MLGARTQLCFTLLLMMKGSDDTPSKLTVPFMLSWKEAEMLSNCGGQPIFFSPHLLRAMKSGIRFSLHFSWS